MSIKIKINESNIIQTEAIKDAVIDVNEIESVESTPDNKTIIYFKNGITMKVKTSVDDIVNKLKKKGVCHEYKKRMVTSKSIKTT